MTNKFDCNEFIKKISFPRLPGTEGEKQAQELIESDLNALNIDLYTKESFVYIRFFMNYLV